MVAKQGETIRCTNCGDGEIAQAELWQVGFEIAHDGEGGWTFTGNRLWEYEDWGGETETFVCRMCGQEMSRKELVEALDNANKEVEA